MELLPIRRYVNHDNSCLFASIAYLTIPENFCDSSALIYRLLIVDYLKNNDFDKSLLGGSKEEYIEQLSEPDFWGGGIELQIFTKIFEVQIASIDVQSGRVDIFGESENYEKRIYVVYNGYHYDPLVMNIDDNDSKSDITRFNIHDDDTLILFKEYVESFRKTGDYLDTSSSTCYICNVCNENFNNEENMMIHGETTQHWDYFKTNI